MSFLAEAYTDRGNFRSNNQDAVCVMEAETAKGNALMVIVCDGMGGLAKGEVASSSVISAFVKWFEEDFPYYVNSSMQQIQNIWLGKLEEINRKLKQYGSSNELTLGTTFSGMLIVDKQYLWMHVGDSRIYHFTNDRTRQITPDHTVVARELARGTMTVEEAARSHKKNKLTQCIGASRTLTPEYGFGAAMEGEMFLLCSDGFYHKLTEQELSMDYWAGANTGNTLGALVKRTVETVISRGEKDNVSAIMLKI